MNFFQIKDIRKYFSKFQSGLVRSKFIDMTLASNQGYISVLKYHHKRDTGIYWINAMDWAAGYGHLEVVIWLSENRKEGCTTKAIDIAVLNNHLDIVKYLSENRKEGCTTNAMNYAAENGHLEIVRYLAENQKNSFTSCAIFSAATNGHITIVKYLNDIKDNMSE